MASTLPGTDHVFPYHPAESTSEHLTFQAIAPKRSELSL